ncbi:CBASS cGAMP-activated phospholipase [Sphingomonas faeni]|uniref:CBASS cGAMP-activated phospholipase n=1 Tax=Sphingomonas faeni TaxID=185950 RepID=UPI0024131469|nr:CBASS cGAMP-activated phospholipase [Sphingomonas faeni]
MTDSTIARRRTFRILALDGGGIKGAFTAAVLASLEAKTGKRASDHFDLITGTSTGGILAIGLGLGFSATELRDFYVKRGPTIFPSTNVQSRLGSFRQLFRPKHSHEVLRDELTAILGDKRLRDSVNRLAIPTYDAVAGRIYIMKTCHCEGLTNDGPAKAADVALATSAAPTYYAAARFSHHQGASYVDGGVWANCPAMVGVTEALAFLRQQPANIDVLSIGTTSSPFNIANQRNAGALGWNVGIISLMFEAQVEAARTQAKLIAGGFHRIDASVPSDQYTLDRANPDTIERLASLGDGEGRKAANLAVVNARFLDGLHAPKYKNSC